ncbi:Lrp/AsnC family transcriptional regulator [Undibacterium sp. RTI2.1]|uniref:Lrp/AsnC family transcriptional regulator n=1 Tax=unclassified Undibacterium TaxID=2630295 RepID=UPI002AB5DB42|nr:MULTISPECIES: Lrp/AsnC family transcriptional regulator [unclassified Undibacterium]MDY7540639.1 Lrp/AsnC family transcriptional regulator [Undibacterium sp. 5I1]MEB0029699.1 Lrp/AsnC family transcriptional regulator [Undibacterium sp. RTI2.1]MEB0117509.1 Lrp/AsnC family transcriptional regulator [Undibacterium sp. RTI2.2]MEB0230815.1 Lrp/AsnC family transcriptional regulator [Undibacterium sp. 10I3]MEB0256604.1 Lrp/AsnC family transcriptional regulator [Undibacterium sp. 5I1]
MQLDATDIKILHYLQTDGRISNQELADKVFLSPSSCLRRVRLLEESGIIQHYSAVLNPTALGLEVDAFVQVTMRRDVEQWHENFTLALQSWPEVVGSYIITGDANYLLRVKARNLKHYSSFVLERLYKTTGVLDIRSNIVLQTLKDTSEIAVDLLQSEK